MDNLIQLLPDHIANQIAAGEVIQRPASVIKELMENAIDAGATKVEVNIKEAGKSLIQVVDNGGGMSPNDAVLCFERHATSKVCNADDLFALSTKGFRGEALASIAAIAHIEMRTKQAENELGTRILIEGSTIVSNEESVCPNGTSFEIKNLFYNVPARRNFLKSNNIEFRHIQEEFERIALVHSDVHFTLHHNDNELYNLAPAVLRKRIVDVLGRNSNDRLVPIEEKTDIVELKGFVLKPEYSRKTRGEQYLFVNDRFFKSSYFHHALGKAFEGLIKDKTFPGYFLYMKVDPSKIDVNVHPTKTEIKFEEEKFIYAILLSSVRQALGKYNIAPTLDFERETSFDLPMEMLSQPVIEPTIQVNTEYNPFNTTSSSSSSGNSRGSNNFSQAVNKHGFGLEKASAADWENFYSVEEESSNEEEQGKLIDNDPETTAGEFIVKGNYILSPSKSGLMIIHARRAIEQIVYSDLINKFISNPIESQRLLFPIEKELSKNEEIAWNENASMLVQLGFHGTANDGQLTLDATPSVLQEETIQKALEKIVETIAHRDIEKGEIAHELVHTIARSAAQKKLNLTNNTLIKELVEQLFQCENHTFTPGNKKIIDTLSIDIIDQKFKQMLRGLFGNIPDVTKNLLIVNVLLYLASHIFYAQGLDLFSLLSSHYLNSEFFAPYQIVTHMFMHSPSDILHIVFNMLLLVMFGSHLERIWGAKKYFMFYIACGLGSFILYNSIGVWQIMELKREIIASGSFEHLGYKSIYGLNEAIANGNFISDLNKVGGYTDVNIINYYYFQTSTLLGASGAIFGLLAGFAILFPNTELMLIFPPIPIKAKYLIGGYLAFEVYNSIYRTDDHIAHLAHVGGAIVGIIIVLIWRKRGRNFY